jgi:serine/threonine protein phosphatase PrpC
MNKSQPILGQRSDQGRVRARNEDAVGGPPPSLDPNLAEQKGYLYAVADGMGGEAGGQQASTLAIQTLLAEYYRDPEPDVGLSLWRAVQAANQSVYRKARTTPALARMGTTMTAIVVRGEELVVAHVGDSRAYLIRNDGIRQLTRDHTWVADAIRAGTISPEEARTHPNRHILNRALGSEPQVEIDVGREKLQPGDRVLLCSDGLTGLVGDNEMLQHVQRLGPLRAPDALVDLANDRGGYDNITAVVVSVPGGPPIRGAVRPAAARRPSRIGFAPVFGGLLAVLMVAVLVFGIKRLGVGQATPVPTEPSPEVVVGATATHTPVTLTLTATSTPTSTETPTATPTGTPTATPTGTPTTTPTATPTPTPTATPTPTSTSTGTPTPTSTDTPMPTATPPPTSTPTVTPTPTPLVYPVDLSEPANGIRLSGTVTFRWTWSGTLGTAETFDVRVCSTEGCQPVSGITNTRDTWHTWCPAYGTGVYRWQVVVILREGEKVINERAHSEVWEFDWAGGCEPPGGDTGGPGGKDG